MGPDTSKSKSIEQQQQDMSVEQQANAKADRDKMQKLEAPLIAKETDLASGDATSALKAAAPEISRISGGFQAAKDNIFNSVAAGPGRDVALAGLETSKDTSIASSLSRQVTQAPEILANLGAGIGGFSLQELGAALSGASGAASTQKDIMGAESATKASTMGMLGQLGGAAGDAAAGGAFGKL